MEINFLAAFAVAFCAAVLSALGMGGGSILLICLTAFMGVDQLQAQGINLGFFLPTAAVAIFLHCRHHLIKWKLALPLVLVGLAGVWAGVQTASAIDRNLLSKAFGILLLIVGIREWRVKPKSEEEKAS